MVNGTQHTHADALFFTSKYNGRGGRAFSDVPTCVRLPLRVCRISSPVACDTQRGRGQPIASI